MSTLRVIHRLLCQEYAISRHIFWRASGGQVYNDVTWSLFLLVRAAQGLRRGEQQPWQRLVQYCVRRAMSPVLLQAMDAYLRPCGEFPPLPLVYLAEQPYHNWQGGTVPLLDETDRPYLHATTPSPEPDRTLTIQGHSCQLSHHPPRLCTRDRHPQPKLKATGTTHWLIA